VDVEGYDLAVLAGAMHQLSNHLWYDGMSFFSLQCVHTLVDGGSLCPENCRPEFQLPLSHYRSHCSNCISDLHAHAPRFTFLIIPGLCSSNTGGSFSRAMAKKGPGATTGRRLGAGWRQWTRWDTLATSREIGKEEKHGMEG